MLKIKSLLLITLFTATAATTQQPALPNEVALYMPKGYEVLNVTKGDLNLDAYPDMILVLNKKDEAKTSDVSNHPERRPLLIFAGGADKKYKLAARSDDAVYCVDCGGMMGDPFQGTTIKRGYFSVEHYGGSAWRWTRIITFKYNPADKAWHLFKDGGQSFYASDPESSSKDYFNKKFGKVRFEKFDIYKE